MPVLKLTQQFIDEELRCPEGKSRIEYCDSDLAGFLLEARASSPGHGTYWVRYKSAQGKTKYAKVGRTTDISLNDARIRAKQLKASIVLGSDPSGEQKARKAVLTFSEFFEQHYLPHAKQHKRSWMRDEQLYRLQLKDTFGNKRLNQITRYEIMKFHSALPDSGLAPASCDHALKVLKHALNLAIDWDLLADKNPAARVPLFNVDNQVEALLTEEELQRLLTVLRTDENRPVCLIMLFLLSTGARLQEALQATWDQINFETRTWNIPAVHSKSKRIRSVVINDSALDVLRQLDTAPEFAHLFINRATGRPYTTVAKVWNRLRQKAGLPKMRVHDARHAHAHMLCAAGRTLLEVQTALGHRHYSTTSRYARLSMKTMHEASNAVSRKIGSSNGATAEPTETTEEQQEAASNASIAIEGAIKKAA